MPWNEMDQISGGVRFHPIYNQRLGAHPGKVNPGWFHQPKLSQNRFAKGVFSGRCFLHGKKKYVPPWSWKWKTTLHERKLILEGPTIHWTMWEEGYVLRWWKPKKTENSNKKLKDLDNNFLKDSEILVLMKFTEMFLLVPKNTWCMQTSKYPIHQGPFLVACGCYTCWSLAVNLWCRLVWAFVVSWRRKNGPGKRGVDRMIRKHKQPCLFVSHKIWVLNGSK